jgi:predicted nucleotidyltransferase
MNEACVWRHALAQQHAPHYRANPKVAALVVGGSVSLGCADRYSDLDLGVFWATPPTEEECREVIERVKATRWQRSAAESGAEQWSEVYEVGGVSVQVRNGTVQSMEALLAEVLERSDPSLLKQQQLAALLSALPLSNPWLVTHWQQQAAVYPAELAVAMVRAHLRFCPAWGQERLAERNELLVLYESFCRTQKQILLVLLGLNRLYYPGFQWVDRLIGQMPLVPPHLASRCKQVFSIVGIDPLAGVYQLHELIEETFRLVQTHLAEVDTTAARAQFADRPKIWEQAPDGLL